VGEEGEHEGSSSAETTYRKVFRRASQCLREAFQFVYPKLRSPSIKRKPILPTFLLI
jgi:hypothetical protein